MMSVELDPAAAVILTGSCGCGNRPIPDTLYIHSPNCKDRNLLRDGYRHMKDVGKMLLFQVTL